MNIEQSVPEQQIEPGAPIIGDPEAAAVLAGLVKLTNGLVVRSTANEVMERINRGEEVLDSEVNPRTHGSETTTFVRQRNRRPGHFALKGTGVL